MPSNAGQAIMSVGDNSPGLLDTAPGLAVFSGYIIVLLATAAFALTRRDA
jgi:hypothetical protein